MMEIVLQTQYLCFLLWTGLKVESRQDESLQHKRGKSATKHEKAGYLRYALFQYLANFLFKEAFPVGQIKPIVMFHS